MIAFDASTGVASSTGTSHTFSHTCTGDNRILFVYGHDASAAASIVTGVTYAGVAMTKVASVRSLSSSGRQLSMWYLVNPATGANNVVVSASGSENLRFSSASFTGAGVVEASNTAANVSTISVSVTTLADNAWTICFGKDEAGSITYSSTTGDTVLVSSDVGGHFSAYGGPKTPAGAKAMSFSQSSSTNAGLIIASFGPYLGISTIYLKGRPRNRYDFTGISLG